MKKNYPLYICIFCAILLNIFILSNSLKSKENQDNYFRLHIVANSNSVDDQIAKLNVVKKIENYLNKLYSNSNITEKEYSKSLIEDNIDNILKVANDELKNQNASYSCYANIGKLNYSKKTSDKITMDKGIYDSVQIVLGDGAGENFWSLIFPYSYNENYNVIKTNEEILNSKLEVKSGILETLKKVVKTLKS